MAALWLSVLVTLAIQSLVSMVVFAPAVLAPAARGAMAMPSSAVGVCTALIYLSATVGALASSRLIPWTGPLRVSQWCLFLCGGGIAVMASASLPLAMLGALLIGLGYGPVTPSSSAILSERVPARLRAFIFSVKQSGVPLGGMLAGGIMPWLIARGGWQAAALLAGGACVLLAVLIQPWRRSADAGFHAATAQRHTSLLQALRLVLGHRPLRDMALASFAYSGMQMSLGSFLVVYLHDRLGYSLALSGAGLAIAMSAGAIGRILWGVVADSLVSPRRVLGLLGVAMSLSAFATAAFTPDWPLALVLVVSGIYGATAVGWNGVYLSEVARMVPPGQAAAATGASLAMTYSGVVTLPFLFTLVLSSTGSYVPAFIGAGCFTLWRSLSFFGDGAEHSALGRR